MTTKHEGLAIVYALQKYRHYLLQSFFKFFIYHSEHAKISKIYVKLEYQKVKLEDQKNTIKLEAHKNIPYSCYTFIYKIVCMERFEWKYDQLFLELLNHVTVIRGKISSWSILT